MQNAFFKVPGIFSIIIIMKFVDHSEEVLELNCLTGVINTHLDITLIQGFS